LTNFEFLSSSPTIIDLYLNEWVSFERPGTYRIQVVSDRVGANTSHPWGEGVEVKSNWMELKIVTPKLSWQQGTLPRIRQHWTRENLAVRTRRTERNRLR